MVMPEPLSNSQISESNEDWWLSVIGAIDKRDCQALVSLFDGLDKDEINDCVPILNYAIKYSSLEVIQTLIELGVSVNNNGHMSTIPLYVAIGTKNPSKVALLVKHEAKSHGVIVDCEPFYSVCDGSGSHVDAFNFVWPIEFAVQTDQLDMTRLLLDQLPATYDYWLLYSCLKAATRTYISTRKDTMFNLLMENADKFLLMPSKHLRFTKHRVYARLFHFASTLPLGEREVAQAFLLSREELVEGVRSYLNWILLHMLRSSNDLLLKELLSRFRASAGKGLLGVLKTQPVLKSKFTEVEPQDCDNNWNEFCARLNIGQMLRQIDGGSDDDTLYSFTSLVNETAENTLGLVKEILSHCGYVLGEQVEVKPVKKKAYPPRTLSVDELVSALMNSFTVSGCNLPVGIKKSSAKYDLASQYKARSWTRWCLEIDGMRVIDDCRIDLVEDKSFEHFAKDPKVDIDKVLDDKLPKLATMKEMFEMMYHFNLIHGQQKLIPRFQIKVGKGLYDLPDLVNMELFHLFSTLFKLKPADITNPYGQYKGQYSLRFHQNSALPTTNLLSLVQPEHIAQLQAIFGSDHQVLRIKQGGERYLTAEDGDREVLYSQSLALKRNGRAVCDKNQQAVAQWAVQVAVPQVIEPADLGDKRLAAGP